MFSGRLFLPFIFIQFLLLLLAYATPTSEYCNLSAFDYSAKTAQPTETARHSTILWDRISRAKQPRDFRQIMHVSITYAFKDVKRAKVDEVVEKIVGGAQSLADMADILFGWYNGLDRAAAGDLDPDYEKGFKKILEKLADFTADQIMHAFGSLKEGTPMHLYDIGAGDGKFSLFVLDAFLSRKFRADMATIDLENDQSEWNSQQLGNLVDGKEEAKKLMTHLTYDGTNLGRKIKEDLAKKKEATTPGEAPLGTNERVAVDFNHSFHHWKNAQAQEETIRSLAEELPMGSVIIFREHFCIMDDVQLTLIHVLFEIRSKMNSLAENKQIVKKWSKKRRYRAKKQKMAELRRHTEKYMDGVAHNYLSPFRLHHIMASNGFELDCHTPEMPGHLNRTIFYVYKKSARKPISADYPFGCFHNLNADKTLKELQEKKFINKEKRTDVPKIVWDGVDVAEGKRTNSV